MNQTGDEANPAPHTRIVALLRSLYGKTAGGHTAVQLAEVVAKWRATQTAAPLSRALSERNVLLITYADQVREPGIAPLRTLAACCEKRLAGIVSGIHFLPFYPWTSDDGFSVQDYFAVAPEYGTWEDVALLREHFDLMFDAVFNHMSAEGIGFDASSETSPSFEISSSRSKAIPIFRKSSARALCRC